MADETSDSSGLVAVWRRLRSVLGPVLEAPSRRFDQAFALGLMFVVGYQLLAAREFSPDGSLFVYVIGVPTFVMAALVLLSTVSSRVGLLMGKLSSELLSVGEDVGSLVDTSTDLDEETARLRVVRTSVWVLVATLLVALFGFIPSILVFMVAFYLIETDIGTWQSVGYAAAIWVIILIVFVELLNTRFYGGVYDVMVYFPYP